jgi:isoleucyl-tRNA synthetase
VWFDSGVTHACVLRRRVLICVRRRTCTWRDQTSTVAGSSPRCSPASGPMVRRRTDSRAHPWLHGGRGGTQDVQVPRQHHPGAQGHDEPARSGCPAPVAGRRRTTATRSACPMRSSSAPADAYRRIRNTARFLLANLNGFDPAQDLLPPQETAAAPGPLGADAAARAAGGAAPGLRRLPVPPGLPRLHNFCANEMGGFYLDIIKDRQYTTRADSLPRRSAQSALYLHRRCAGALDGAVLSFTAEEIWENLAGRARETRCCWRPGGRALRLDCPPTAPSMRISGTRIVVGARGREPPSRVSARRR